LIELCESRVRGVREWELFPSLSLFSLLCALVSHLSLSLSRAGAARVADGLDFEDAVLHGEGVEAGVEPVQHVRHLEREGEGEKEGGRKRGRGKSVRRENRVRRREKGREKGRESRGPPCCSLMLAPRSMQCKHRAPLCFVLVLCACALCLCFVLVLCACAWAWPVRSGRAQRRTQGEDVGGHRNRRRRKRGG
jgi:hypothetical protein